MKKEIIIGGMHCSHCVRHIEEAMEEIRAKNVKVNLDTEITVVEFDTIIPDSVIVNAIEDIGYEVIGIRDI